VERADLGLWAEQIRGADLDRRSAQSKGGGNASRVGDAPAAITGTRTASTTCGTNAMVPA